MMVLFGVEIKTWRGTPGPFLVVTKAGEGYWANSFGAAQALASDVEEGSGTLARVFSTQFFTT